MGEEKKNASVYLRSFQKELHSSTLNRTSTANTYPKSKNDKELTRPVLEDFLPFFPRKK